MSRCFDIPARLALALATLALLPAAAHAGWGAGGIPATRAALSQSRPVAVGDGAGGLIAAWLDPRSGYNTDVFAQRVMPVGSIGTNWASDGMELTHVTCSKYDLALASDGAGGAIATWADVRCPGDGIARVYAQRVLPTGLRDPAWPTQGRALCTATALQERPAIVPDGTGGAYVVWNDRRTGRFGLYATRLQADGTLAAGWPDSGRFVSSVVRDSSGAVLASDDAGGVYVAWLTPSPAADTVHVQRLLPDGSIAPGWPANGVIACNRPGRRGGVVLATAANGDLWAGWWDMRDGNADVYATRLTPTGSLASGWPAGGLAVAAGALAQDSPAITGVAGDRCAFAWVDAATGGGDIGVQLLEANGAPAPGWPAGGRAACSAPLAQSAPVVTPGDGGGVIVGWTDAREQASTGLDVYANRFAAEGTLAAGWPADGHALCRQPADQSSLAIVPDGSGGVMGIWLDARNSASSGLDLYANRLGPDGPLPTQVRDLAAVHHDGQTFLTATAPASTGYVYRFYASATPITSAADLAGATFLGSPMDSSWYMKRLSEFTGTRYAYCVDSLAAPLDSTQLLFVVTPTSNGTRWYAATAQAADAEEDVAITPGENALTSPVQEFVNRPRPVYQRRIRVHDQPTDMYTLWTSAADTPLFPAMSNRTSLPFDCAIRPGYTSLDSTSLLVRPATRNLYCLNVIWWTPGYWLMAFDDLLPSVQGSFYFGYHENFDLSLPAQAPPTGGVVRDYTRARCVFLLDWARRTLPVDTARVYTFGYSLAGAAAATLAFAAPQWIAGTQSVSGHYDYSFRDEPVAGSGFNPGQYYENLMNELWGPLALDLPTNLGLGVYEATDASFLAGHMEPVAVPPLMSFDGKRDVPMGWAEKVSFYRAMQRHRQGGTFFWDLHEHNTDTAQMWWLPMIGPGFLWRYSSAMSYPALSNCSADHDPGDGDPTHGDSLGTINGFVQWDSLLVDQADGWSCTLRPRDLQTLLGPMPAPDSFTVDVTPRRLQAFFTSPGDVKPWRVLRIDDDVIVQSGLVTADSLGRLTLEGVKVYRGGSLVMIGDEALLDTGPRPAAPLPELALSLGRQPLRGAGEVLAAWPRAGAARLELFDVGGRRVRTLHHGPASAGPARYPLPANALRAGLYWVVASQGEARVTKRLVVLE